MSSLRHREIGAQVRHAALNCTDTYITIDHKTYRVTCEQVQGTPLDRFIADERVRDPKFAAVFDALTNEQATTESPPLG